MKQEIVFWALPNSFIKLKAIAKTPHFYSWFNIELMNINISLYLFCYLIPPFDNKTIIKLK